MSKPQTSIRHWDYADKLQRFINSRRVNILFPDDFTILQYAQLYRQLRQSGRPIPDNDLWTAALVLQHGCVLATRDKHFQNYRK